MNDMDSQSVRVSCKWDKACGTRTGNPGESSEITVTSKLTQ